MSVASRPIHPGFCMLSDNSPPWMELPQVYHDFRDIGLHPLIDDEECVYDYGVRDFYSRFRFYRAGYISCPATPIRYALETNYYRKSIEDFSNLLGFNPYPLGIKFYNHSLTFSEENLAGSEVSRDAMFETIVNHEHMRLCKITGQVQFKHLNPELVTHYRIIRENLTCRSMIGWSDELVQVTPVSVTEGFVLFCLKHGIRVSAGFIIANVMQDALESHSERPLPYGMMLTNLFRDIGAVRLYKRGLTYSLGRLGLI